MTFLKASGSVLKANVEKEGKDIQQSITQEKRLKKTVDILLLYYFL